MVCGPDPGLFSIGVGTTRISLEKCLGRRRRDPPLAPAQRLRLDADVLPSVRRPVHGITTVAVMVVASVSCTNEASGIWPGGDGAAGGSGSGGGSSGASSGGATDGAGPGSPGDDAGPGSTGDSASAGSGSDDASPPGFDAADDGGPLDSASSLDEGAPADGQSMTIPPTPDGGVGPSPVGTGWTEIFPTYKVDQPPGQTRYTLTGDEFHFWLFNTDLSTYPGHDSGPRSELRWYNDYTTGQAQFQGDILINHNCAHASVMQIFGGSTGTTAFMAWAMPNSLNYYGGQTIVSPVYDMVFRLNVTHDTSTGVIDVYIDGQQKATFRDHGPATHYFKCGIYHQVNMTPRCDVNIRGIHIFKK
jgi:hypothetical protein